MLDRVEMRYVFLKSLYFCPLFYSPCYKAHWYSDLSPYKAPVLLRLSGPYRQRQDIEGFELQSLSSSKHCFNPAHFHARYNSLSPTFPRGNAWFPEAVVSGRPGFSGGVFPDRGARAGRAAAGPWGALPFPLCWPGAHQGRSSEPLLLLAQPLLPPGTASRRVVTGPLLQSDRMGTTNLVLTDRGFWLFKSIVLTLAGKN